MEITRDVILDLLPLYLAGEVSEDTRSLVENYLEEDPKLAAIAARFDEMELENNIRLQVKEAYHNLEVAGKAVISTEDALKSRREVLSIVSKKYREGMVPQIEYMKARNDFTSAGINHIIAIYDYYIKEAQLERVAAYDFKKESHNEKNKI